MPRATTPSFITTIPLVVTSQNEAELLSRFQAGRQLYNALLNESMVRLNLVCCSELFQAAKKLPKGKIRNDAFDAAKKEYRYSEYDIQAYATIVSNRAKWIAQKIDSNTQQTLAKRAFQASQKVMLGRAKKVRLKVPNRFNSVEGKTNKQGIRWVVNQLVWGKLKFNAMIDSTNPVTSHGLESRIKYVRLLRKEIRGKQRWFAQLICEGIPFQKTANFTEQGIVGLDLNISNVAYVANNSAGLLPFAEKVSTFERQIKASQRQMQRSQRASNPNNYEPDFNGRKGRKTVVKKGKAKKGCRKWNKTKRYLKITSKKRELERRKAAYSKSQNRKLVNDILRNGNQIKTENVSVKGWQKRYGKAISAKSPGYFQSELKRKAESAGGSFTKFSTQKTALSQTHLTGKRIKKTLSERVHYDETGIVMDRDLFSAYLARYVDENQLSLQDAVKSYPGMESFLLEAWQRHKTNRKQVSIAENRKAHPPSERFSSNSEKINQIDDFNESGRKVN
ncbi:transposase [Plectonema radiosum NIES-515]|uniref:Transposase n=1 Tax=Plectonema radiosum NIES-515 TaxID=2986073 RepID=A0ABT3B1D6_9CYAN|nr:transposase [Plectonema radiosum]MCV3215180.1 transposase [Plectonema radiosum NIES-515]